MRKRTSLKDIAEKVGVSTALVSYVMNGKMEGRISREIAKKIRDTAAKMNYRPNHIARSLKMSRTRTLGLIVADISNPFSSGLARIIEDEADRLGYTVIFASSDEHAGKSGRLIEALNNRQVDGLIVMPPADAGNQIKQLKKQGVPFVLVDRYFPGINCNWVCIDNRTASADAVNHLVRAGRRHIGMITYRSTMHHLKDRVDGYVEALKSHRMKVAPHFIREVGIGNNQEEITAAVAALVESDTPVDAILFASNRIASAALKYIDQEKINVPADLCLVSFDETDVFDFFYAPLSFIRQPLVEIGQQAVTILIENLETPVKPKKLSLAAQLIVRESSVPRPRITA